MENEVIENVDDELVGDVVDNNEVDDRPTREFLLECFNYNPDTGEFRWNVRPLHHFKNSTTMNAWNTKYSNRELKLLDNGRSKISLSFNDIRKTYTAEILIWKMMHDEYPDTDILHINKIKTDNRIVNLQKRTKNPNSNWAERWSNKSIDLGTKEYFDRYVRYEKETGKLFWKDRDVSQFKSEAAYKTWKTRYFNREVRKVDKDGYYRVSLEGKEYKAHRVIWLMYYNEDPKDFFIDHINGVKNDNRIENLRKATGSQNNRNQTKLARHNSTGYRGIYKGSTEGSWSVRLLLDGKLRTIGTFYDLDEAIEARRKAVEKHYGEFGGLV